MNPNENPTIKLNPTGNHMPLVGLGMWNVPKDKVHDIVLEAFKVGYRLVVNISASFFHLISS
jgi:diketogulonate reductase-like aldo/keto reductase